MWFLVLFLVLNKYTVHGDFNPDTSKYDAYGVKIAVNDMLLVEAQNAASTFLVQFSPYNYTTSTLQCTIDFDDTTHYVYTVGVGFYQNTSVYPYFYFAGEMPNGWATSDSSGHNGTFIGIWTNQDPNNIQFYVNSQQSISCDYFQVENLQFISTYGHQEFFVVAIEPFGQYAIGMTTDFIFIYYPFSSSNITLKQSTPVWPNNATFYSFAADATGAFTVVAGLVKNSAQSQVRATPTVYVLRNSNLSIVASWSYSVTSNTWQSYLTYSNSDSWSSKYTMSVKINSADSARVLVGMPFINTVFLFVVSNNGSSISLASSGSNCQYVGYGKSVAWLTSSQAAVLVSTYSLDYSTWYSSNIYLYTSLTTTTIPSSYSALIPNIQQQLPSTISSQLIQAVSTPESLAVLDVNGNILLILATPAGTYAATDSSSLSGTASIPAVSSSTACIAGTYKSSSGIHPCSLCPSGTRNPGGGPCTSCINCSSNSFCPWGAVFEVNETYITSQSQAYAYPHSPELTAYEDIVLSNSFAIGSTSHCIVTSPLFWALIIAGLGVIIIIVMNTLHFFLHPQKSDKWRKTIKKIFRQTDLIVSFSFDILFFHYRQSRVVEFDKVKVNYG
ncbi:unnamed protein product [Rotaria magnacalcarata]|uniref:Uncharacterized protein n=1 Tax=Rotaria magnacalcarata TaxID=392030 RepID=A0A816KRS5_9BILA|nr:unnamed protein product [Rotaria magnacalcarata]